MSKANTRLPRDRDQVAAFVGACRLSDGQVARVLALWDRLTASAADVVVEGELVEEGGRAVEKVRVHTTDARVVEPVITTNLNAVLPSSFVVNGGTVHLTSTHNTTMTEQHGGLEEGPCEAHELRSLRIRRLRFQILLLTPLTLATTVAVGTSFHEPALIALATTMLLFLAHEEVRKLNRDRR
ncbi:hypothetical protein APASM_6178 [Actinosynnema pretiosum subsp. pretiosum]|nr:hypothetical protein APASM_6178 [Actinosynnema pretiosum subsp. pretiosum]